MSLKDEIGVSKFHPILGAVKIAEENLINSIPERIIVYAGDADSPQIFHVRESDLKSVCLKCDGDRVVDFGELVIECPACKGMGYT